jgi:hypothetical protein
MPVSACCRVLGQVKKSDGMVGSPFRQAGARSVSRSPAPAWPLSVMGGGYAFWRRVATGVLTRGFTLEGWGRCGGGLGDAHSHVSPAGLTSQVDKGARCAQAGDDWSVRLPDDDSEWAERSERARGTTLPNASPPPPTPPHKGEGSRPSLPLQLISIQRDTL